MLLQSRLWWWLAVLRVRDLVRSGTKGSSSKFVIEDEGVHLSVGDEGERDEGVKGGGDDEDEDEADEEEHPQVSSKRK
ncbi:hypothetical protein Hanom_Chr11g00998661 [Helianthus anomalus]